MQDLLTAATAGDYLVERGLVSAGTELEVRELGGGVSNVVLAVTSATGGVVVKQSLPRLRVEQEWLAKRERILTEADALRLAGTLTPDAVPGVRAVDEERCAIVIDLAPDGRGAWKTDLLGGRADPAVAAQLGALLATWHRETADDPAVAARFDDHEAFEQLRVDPYLRAVMRRWPRLERPVGAYVEQMTATRVCLVHGDFSPKNVLVGADGLWVIDFEVAHVGEPVFDLAFMTNHLMLKAIHRPADRGAYRAVSLAFLATYEERAGSAVSFEPPYLVGLTGCLMVARVDGKSPAEYLTGTERLVARTLGSRLLLDPPASPAAAWDELAAAIAG